MSEALGEIQSRVETGLVGIVLTPILQLFLEDFDWCRISGNALLRDIYNLLTQWFLQPHDALILVELSSLDAVGAHPIPSDCGTEGNVALWAEELQKLLEVHESCIGQPGEFFIGVACHFAFSGGKLGSYSPEDAPALPLVGPSQLDNLSDAFDWKVQPDDIRQPVSFASAKQNVFALGAIELKTPSGGSHYKVYFRDTCRPWILDRNEDPLRDDFVRQLVPLTSYPFNVVKVVLLRGSMPERVCKLFRTNLIPPTAILVGG
ncbi:MAG: hypothetical protein WCC87_00660 [Candidatus Korobacteraceae bacterium]